LRFLKFLGAALLLLLSLATLWSFWFPQAFLLRDRRATLTFQLPDNDDRLSPFALGPRNPLWTPLRGIARPLRVAVVASEDDRFYEHRGLDFVELRHSVERNIERGAYVRGGSTITMQLARTLFLTREKTLRRKIAETVLALELELLLDKARILELYLNVVDWGPGIRGIGRAAAVYYRRPPSALGWGESAYLAVMLPNPYRYNSGVSPSALRERQHRLVVRLMRERRITPAAAAAALAAPPPLAAN
jgi:monofunctional glycosyltransferase